MGLDGNLYWHGIFKGRRDYGWHCNHGNAYALDLPGHRLQSYFARSNLYVVSRYLVNVYVGKDDIIQEVLYKKSKQDVDYVPISPVAFHNLFPNFQELEVKEAWGRGNDLWKYLETVERDGRILFKFKRKDWRKFIWGVNLDSIACTFAGLMIRKFGPAIAFASIYKDTIKNLDDAANVLETVNSLSLINYKRNGFYEREIKRLRDQLKEESGKIEEYNLRIDETCNGAADALNVLSEKFGIVVNV